MSASPSLRKNALRGAIAALLLGAAAATWAAVSLPPVHVQGVVRYVSGGIGADEAAAMQSASAQYPLTIEFVRNDARGHGAYLAGVKVVISDMHGQTQLDAVADGPFLLVQLPEGKYRIFATDEGQPKQQIVTIKPQSPVRVVFAW